MKKLILVLLLALSFCAHAQYSVYDTVDFDFNQTHIFIPDDSTAGQWQIGTPTKTVFTNALIGTKSIVTDTINTYIPGTKSVFYLYPLDLSTQDFSFTHSINADSLHSGGYIEMTYDNINWYNILDTAVTNHFYSITGNWIDGLLYYNGNAPITTLFNGKKGFTGNFSGKTYAFGWGFFPIVKAGFGGGSFRFVFESDSLATPMDGWMIDDIKLQATQLYSTTENLSKSITLYPNPAIDKLAIDFDENKFKPTNYRITSITGQEIRKGNLTGRVIDVATFPQGSYFITLTDAKGNSGVKMFYKE